jgi:hypothetical protein
MLVDGPADVERGERLAKAGVVGHGKPRRGASRVSEGKGLSPVLRRLSSG